MNEGAYFARIESGGRSLPTVLTRMARAGPLTGVEGLVSIIFCRIQRPRGVSSGVRAVRQTAAANSGA